MANVQSSHHILAINNSEDVLELFRELLEDEGYRVSVQPYLDKDIDAISTLRPDLIILDYMWEGEDSGWALLQMLKMSPKTKDIPIVICTGAVKQVEALNAHLMQMQVQVVLKPFDIEKLLKVIDEAVDITVNGESQTSEMDTATMECPGLGRIAR